MWGASPSPVLLGTYSFGADTLRISLHVQLCSLWVCLCLPVGSLGPKAWCRLGERLEEGAGGQGKGGLVLACSRWGHMQACYRSLSDRLFVRRAGNLL